jgi:hypothetical protein
VVGKGSQDKNHGFVSTPGKGLSHQFRLRLGIAEGGRGGSVVKGAIVRWAF